MKLTTITILSSLTLVLSTLYSCRKETIPIQDDTTSYGTCDCEEIPAIDGYSIGYTYVFDAQYSFWPSVNPNNDNQLIFCEWSGNGIQKTIYRYDATSQEKEAIYTGDLLSAPQWGRQNDIVFTSVDGHVWKMNLDGSGLAQVTQGGQFHHPRFNDTGDQIMTYHAFVDPKDHHQGKIFDLNGSLLDSISQPTQKGHWLGNATFISAYADVLQAIDMNSKDVIAEYTNGNTDKPIMDVVWLNDAELVFTNNDGIFKLNIWTQSLDRIRCACSSRSYRFGTVSQSGDRILYQKTTLTPAGGTMLNEKSELVWVDLDGTEMAL